MPDPLTPLERRVYHYLIDYLAAHTYQPSVREIARRFQIRSTKSVAELIESLAVKGYVERPKGRSRGVKLIGYSSIGRTQPVPVYERVTAAEPYLRDEHRSRFVAMDRALLPCDEAFLLRVPDDAMQGRAILANDLVLLDPSARSRDGDLAAVRSGSSLLLRLLNHHGASIVLTGATGNVPEMTLGTGDDFSVLGVVAGVLRVQLNDRDEAGGEIGPT